MTRAVAARPASAGRLELVTDGLSFPTSLTFDLEGAAYVAESGLPFGGARAGGRVWRISPEGRRALVTDDLTPPVNGLTYHQGGLLVSAGSPGRILRLALDGRRTLIVEGMPGPGNYHTNMVAVGPDGWLYFSQGAMTNTGIIGLDAYAVKWLGGLPQAADIPGYDVVLRGHNVETPDPLSPSLGAGTRTGAFSPFGVPTVSGHRVSGRVPCTAAMMRCRPDGRDLELVAWGLRNAYGLGFLPDGRLLATDQGADDRGSRPVGDAPDCLFEIKAGAWYGWPDFIGGVPITMSRFRPDRGPAPQFLLANHHDLPLPERPVACFEPHACAVKFDVAPDGAPNAGQIFLALFGDERPMTAGGGPRVGRSVVRLDPRDWSVRQVVATPFRRPIDVRFDPITGIAHVLDFGDFEIEEDGALCASAETGRLWRLIP